VKKGDPVKIEILRQGGVIANHAAIRAVGENVVAIAVDMKTKRGEFSGDFGGFPEGPGVTLSCVEGSLHFKEGLQEVETWIAFPEFNEWTVWCCDYGKYTVAVCLIKNKYEDVLP
jgi:hypothetical protein